MAGLLGGGLFALIFGNFTLTGLNSAAGGVFNWVMSIIYQIITESWGNILADPLTMMIVKNVNLALMAIGVALVNVFTLANVAKTTASMMEMKRPAVLFRVAIKLILSDAAVIYSYDIFRELYNIFAALAKVIFSAAGYNPATGFTFSDATNGITINVFGEMLAMMLSLAVFVATVVVCFSVLLTVLGRFFKIFLYSMIAPVPLALLACEETDHMGKRYLASFFCVCMEGLVIAGACTLFAACFANGSILTQFGGAAKLAEALSVFGDSAESIAGQVMLLLDISIFAGMVKGSDRVVRELIG